MSDTVNSKILTQPASTWALNRFSPYIWLLLPFMIGIFLRILRVEAQILGGDELHEVRAALKFPLGYILTKHTTVHHTLPLAAYYRILMNLGICCSEMTFRFPILLGGISLMILAPLSAAYHVGRSVAYPYAWLIAFSPVLLFYSRIVRGYMPLVFLSFAAVMAFYTWLHTGKKVFAGTYMFLAAFSVYMHLLSFPFIMAPFVFAFLEQWVKPDSCTPRFKSLLLMFSGTIGLITCCIFPTLPSLMQLTTLRFRRGSLNLKTITGTIQNMAGSYALSVVVLFWILAALGFILLLKRKPRFAKYSFILVFGHISGILVLAPTLYQNPIVFNRYNMVVLPFILLWIAAGLGLPWLSKQDIKGIIVQRVICAIFIVILVLSGPLGDAMTYSSSFTHHNDYLAIHRPRLSIVDSSEIPLFYQNLRKERGVHPIIEFPWNGAWVFTRVPYVYQNFHKQPVLMTRVSSFYKDPRLCLKLHIDSDPSSLLASKARYLVIHFDLLSEQNRFKFAPYIRRGKKYSRMALRLKNAAKSMSSKLEKRWGNPQYSDDWIKVWDLDLIRQRLGKTSTL